MLLVSFFLVFISDLHAGGLNNVLTAKVGVGKSTSNAELNVNDLVSKGYQINNYSQGLSSSSSYSFSLAYSLTSRASIELGLQSFGRTRSTLDVEIPVGKLPQQAAEEIVTASPQKVGGTFVTLATNYIYPLTSRLDLRLGTGLVLGRDDHEVKINDDVFDVQNNVAEPFVKLGVGVKITEKIAVTGSIERYFITDPVDRYEIGMSYSIK